MTLSMNMLQNLEIVVISPQSSYRNKELMKRISIFRKAHFNAAHKLSIPEWTDEKNWEIFGRCSYPNFHGHNYELEVKVTGNIDPVSGFVMNLKDLKRIIREEVEDRFDHKNLNLDIPEFKETLPTTENLCILIYELIKPRLNPDFELNIRLYETARNYVEYPV